MLFQVQSTLFYPQSSQFLLVLAPIPMLHVEVMLNRVEHLHEKRRDDDQDDDEMPAYHEVASFRVHVVVVDCVRLR